MRGQALRDDGSVGKRRTEMRGQALRVDRDAGTGAPRRGRVRLARGNRRKFARHSPALAAAFKPQPDRSRRLRKCGDRRCEATKVKEGYNVYDLLALSRGDSRSIVTGPEFVKVTCMSA
jgi:hypothetical protein